MNHFIAIEETRTHTDYIDNLSNQEIQDFLDVAKPIKEDMIKTYKDQEDNVDTIEEREALFLLEVRTKRLVKIIIYCYQLLADRPS